MIWAYLFYGLAVVSGIGFFIYIVKDAWGWGDWFIGAFVGILVAMCFGGMGLMIHAMVWESQQPAYSLPKHRWFCTATRQEMVTSTTIVNNVPITNTSYHTVCTQYTER